LRIRNHLYYYKTIEVLIMDNCNVNDNMAKEIADGIMKAKSLEKISLRSNRMTGGLASILYNLAFQPSLKYVDISQNTTLNLKETSNSLYKLIKMSQSLETLIIKGIPNLIQDLAATNDFFNSLGDNSSLKHLDFSQSGGFTDQSIKNLAVALAFNHKKNGALTKLNLGSTGLTYQMLTNFIEHMMVSEETHFQWYGSSFNTSILKDSKEYFEKHFFCKINVLDISSSDLKTYININDLKTNPKNIFRNLFEQNPHLEVLNISNCQINKFFVEMLADCLKNPNGIKTLLASGCTFTGELVKNFLNQLHKDGVVNPNFHIEVLDLSKNRFGYSGIEAIAAFLKANAPIRVLNLYYGFFDVDGARSLSKALAVNKVLEYLDIGYNRIKDLGFCEITNAIVSNTGSNLKFLGSRYNLIKNRTASL